MIGIFEIKETNDMLLIFHSFSRGKTCHNKQPMLTSMNLFGEQHKYF